jgi:FAD/FMN-containing dehydrogenase
VGPAALELVNDPAWQIAAGTVPAPDRFVLLLVFAGDEEAVAWQQAALEETAARVGQRAYPVPPLHAEVWFHALRDYPARPGLVVRLAARSSDTTALCAAAEALAEGAQGSAEVVAHAASGVVWARVPDAPAERVPALVEALRGAAAERDGTAVVQRLPADFTGTVDRWGPPPAGFALMRRIKETLDPKGIMSTGRFAGGL